VLCWGLNDYGQLGYGHTNVIGNNELPASAGYVQMPGGIPVSQVVAGIFHTCALTSNGSVLCWGYNSGGELGLGHVNDIGDNELPSTAGFIKLGVGVIAKRLGSGPNAHHTCALVAQGSAICWGNNDAGQLGYGHWNYIGDNEYPSAAGFVNASATFSDIRCGYLHTCGLYTNGSVKCVLRKLSSSYIARVRLVLDSDTGCSCM
jgi:alpha-tubulin suppressor-like RCC1 family protein